MQQLRATAKKYLPTVATLTFLSSGHDLMPLVNKLKGNLWDKVCILCIFVLNLFSTEIPFPYCLKYNQNFITLTYTFHRFLHILNLFANYY